MKKNESELACLSRTESERWRNCWCPSTSLSRPESCGTVKPCGKFNGQQQQWDDKFDWIPQDVNLSPQLAPDPTNFRISTNIYEIYFISDVKHTRLSAESPQLCIFRLFSDINFRYPTTATRRNARPTKLTFLLMCSNSSSSSDEEKSEDDGDLKSQSERDSQART